MIEATAAAQRTMRTRDVGWLGQRGMQVSFACEHGATSRLVFPGQSPLPDRILRDILIAAHGAEAGCRCAETLRRPAHPD